MYNNHYVDKETGLPLTEDRWDHSLLFSNVFSKEILRLAREYDDYDEYYDEESCDRKDSEFDNIAMITD